ncbi:hypothetical protein CDL12_06029 [Handroanthus impetiginosus]|uniref:DDE Tnp4 domain-containing protein n=1 Tax=Handroanthus impetiginosus TaxID=429701 RepID=A0A2G9HUS8_9LAMI|nr:hypothetical protein CDL12_06029 [Handroanthus impetiginosus]
MINKMLDQFKHLREIVELNNQSCINNLCMDRNLFLKLHYILEHVRCIQNEHYVLAPYRSRKGHTAVIVLGICNRDMNFIYILTRWKGPATNSQVPMDALNWPHVNFLFYPMLGLVLFETKMLFLVMRTCRDFFSHTMASNVTFRTGIMDLSSPQKLKEYFNLRHTKVWNVIKRKFGLLKGRCAVLGLPIFYKPRCKILSSLLVQHVDLNVNVDINDIDIELVKSIEGGTISNTSKYNLANKMYHAWREQ